jgi:hypothetical protein
MLVKDAADLAAGFHLIPAVNADRLWPQSGSSDHPRRRDCIVGVEDQYGVAEQLGVSAKGRRLVGEGHHPGMRHRA